INLRRSDRDQRGDAKSPNWSPHSPCEKRSQKKSQNAEESGHVPQRVHRFGSEHRLPDVGRDNVKKSYRRKNGVRQTLLRRNIAFDHIGIGSNSDFREMIDVLAIEIFVEADLVKSRPRMERGREMQ